jgi:hypothetical protein
MRRTIMIAIAAASISLVACVNPYTKFYTGKPNGQDVPSYAPASGPLQIYTTSDLRADIQALERRGYAPIGESSFNANASNVSADQLREQAKKVGAAAVLLSTKYTNSVTGAVPLVMPNSSTTNITGTYGSATATTYGTNTVMMPYNVRRNDFDAVYFVKVHARFGAFYNSTDSATRTRLQTNAGVVIMTIVDGSPAAIADVLPGDIVLTVNGQRVDGVEQMNADIKAHYGQSVVLGIDRDGTRLEKTVALLP